MLVYLPCALNKRPNCLLCINAYSQQRAVNSIKHIHSQSVSFSLTISIRRIFHSCRRRRRPSQFADTPSYLIEYTAAPSTRSLLGLFACCCFSLTSSLRYKVYVCVCVCVLYTTQVSSLLSTELARLSQDTH